jgi:ABC-type uncharacterized transport system substrate-binding protein
MSIIKKSVYCVIGLLFIAGVYLFYPVRKKFEVAFLYATNIVYHIDVHDHFMKEIVKVMPSDVYVEAFGTPDIKDKLLIDNICERIFTLQPACIVVVGKIMSQAVVELAKKRNYYRPIVFIGVDRPVEIGAVESLDRPGGNVTGLFTTEADKTVSARLFYLTLPNVKKALIPFYSSNDIGQVIEARAEAIKTYLGAKDIYVQLMPIDNLTNALYLIESVLSQYDSLVILEACTLSGTYTSGLIKLAEKYKMKLMATIPDKDFLLSYAIEPRYISAAAVDLVKSIICDKKNPATTPVVRMSSSREFMINTKRAAELGISLDIEHIMNQINTDPALEVVRNRVRIV